MRSTQSENVQEHCLQVAMIAHCLALVSRKFYGGSANPESVAVHAMFHDASEVLTGDLPTPVKYFNGEIRDAYRSIEGHAAQQLLKLLPEDLKSDYENILSHQEGDPEIHRLVKAADTLAAYIKCLEEKAAGNGEFLKAEKAIELKLKGLKSQPEVEYFMRVFIPGFSLTLDEISQPLEL